MNDLPRWRKSSHSDDQGGQCVEVARFTAEQWRKSSHSDDQGGDCVEVSRARCPCRDHSPVIAVRDSKDPDGPILAFTPPEWSTLLCSMLSHSRGRR